MEVNSFLHIPKYSGEFSVLILLNLQSRSADHWLLLQETFCSPGLQDPRARYRRYDGTYAVAEDMVTGKYSDGEKWGSGYTAAFDGDYMTLTADNGSGEVCKYEKASLDQSEKDKADVVTKSEDSVERFL